MPLQNRVTPFGDIIPTPEKGLFMGNRGAIHRPDQTLKRRHWPKGAWIICRLDWKGINRIAKYGRLMSPSHYTELFFLDEATALAAGHRPCSECQRERLQAFQAAWVEPGARVGVIDPVLHADRVTAEGRKVTFRAALPALPDGAMVELADAPGIAWLLMRRRLLRWSPGGYTEARAAGNPLEVTVLTPRSIVAALRNGYGPVLHPSAQGLV